ncbi:MAG: hypothetical protein ACPGVB_12320 [Chitinophagales bacterium]
MKKITLSELKKLNNVKEVNDSKMTNVKGGNSTKPPVIKLVLGAVKNNLGFIPPPGI